MRTTCKDLLMVNFSLQEDGQTFCLSTSAKYLLIAAYCASYNPPSSDRRFFTKVIMWIIQSYFHMSCITLFSHTEYLCNTLVTDELIVTNRVIMLS